MIVLINVLTEYYSTRIIIIIVYICKWCIIVEHLLMCEALDGRPCSQTAFMCMHVLCLVYSRCTSYELLGSLASQTLSGGEFGSQHYTCQTSSFMSIGTYNVGNNLCEFKKKKDKNVN